MKKIKKCMWGRLLFTAFLFAAVLCPAGYAFAAPAPAPQVLAITKLVFAGDITGLGQYSPKQGSRFVMGDICTIYLETNGFTMNPKTKAEEEFDLDLAVDVSVRRQQGKRVLVSEKDFNTLKTSVRSKLPATFMAFGFAFDDDWDPDVYVMDLTLRDNLSSQSVTQQLIFQLEEPTEADLARQAKENQKQQAPK